MEEMLKVIRGVKHWILRYVVTNQEWNNKAAGKDFKKDTQKPEAMELSEKLVWKNKKEGITKKEIQCNLKTG